MVKKENGNKWAPRSKATVLQQEELERERQKVQSLITRQNEKVAGLQQERDAYARQTLTGTGFASERLDHCLEELRNTEERLDVWHEQLERVEKQLESCEPTAEEAAEREKNQNALAALAEERLAADQQIHEQLGQLRSLLGKRRELTGGMQEKARTLEMGVDEVLICGPSRFDVDQDRFDALLNSLAANVLARSETWVDWLFGRQGGEVRAVARERLERRETLTHTGIYNLGEGVELSQAEYDQLHRTDRPAKDNNAPWRCQPPSVFSVEEYERACAEAGKKGVPLEEIVIFQDVRRFQQDKERYHAPKRAAEARADVARLGTPVHR